MLALTSVLASCKKEPELSTPTTTSYSSPVSYVGNTERPREEEKPDYTLTSCQETNKNYDLSPYKMHSEDELYKATDVDVSEADLKSYAKDKLDYILKSDDKSVRGLFQDFEVEIVRINVFGEWASSCGLNVCGRGINGLYVGYFKPMADGGAYQELQFFDVYKDPSGCFVLVTACMDYKIISEFFENGSLIKGGPVLSVADYNRDTYREFFTSKRCTEDQALEWSKGHSVVVFENGVCTSGEGFWGGFNNSANEGNDAFVMLAKYYTPDEEHAGQELYRPRLIFYFIEYRTFSDFDFCLYFRNSRGNYSTVEERYYHYLLHFYGKNTEPSEYAYYDVYVLSNDKDLTWEDVKKGMADYPYPGENFCIVYSELYGKGAENN